MEAFILLPPSAAKQRKSSSSQRTCSLLTPCHAAGVIHQAQAQPGQSSLHLTISANQRNTWADFLELALPAAVRIASEEVPEMRESLPAHSTSYMVRPLHCLKIDPTSLLTAWSAPKMELAKLRVKDC